MTEEPTNYVVILYPNVGAPESEDTADAYGPFTRSDALAAQESVLRGTPNVGIEVARLHGVADLFKRLPLP